MNVKHVLKATEVDYLKLIMYKGEQDQKYGVWWRASQEKNKLRGYFSDLPRLSPEGQAKRGASDNGEEWQEWLVV